MTRKEFAELEATGQLPSPTGVGMRILVLTQRDDCSLEELAEVIQADPALSGRILKLANSAHGSATRPVATVKEAALRLGQRSVTALALGFSLISSNRNGSCSAFDYDAYWSNSLARGLAAQWISRHLSLANPSEAFTAALLSRIGELALATVHPEEYARILERAGSEPETELRRLESEFFRIDHVEVAESLMRSWGLPEVFSDAVALLEDHSGAEGELEGEAVELLEVMRDAAVLASLCMRPSDPGPILAEEARALRLKLSLRGVELQAVLERLADDWGSWGALLDLPTRELASRIDPADVLRRIERRSAELVRDDVEPSQEGRVRLLAVDDDPFSLKLIARLLEESGHEVYTARNGREALAMTLKVRPQLVVTDWSMPDIDGIDFCRALRRTRFGRRIYVLLLTGHGDEERILQAFDAGVDDYVVKPFKPRLLLARLRAGLRLVRLQEQAERDRAIHVRSAANQARMNRQLREAAETDYLTQLPNRRFAMENFSREWRRAAEDGTALSLIMLDIDSFKSINDRFGHDVGDTVLRETARVMRSSTRRRDIAARIGGEEFLVICPGADLEAARGLAERILSEVRSNHISAGAFDDNVTVSAGVATLGPHVQDVDHLLRLADEAVYRAKELGRDRVELAGSEGSQTAQSA